MAGFEVIIYGRFWVIAEGNDSGKETNSNEFPISERAQSVNATFVICFYIDGLHRGSSVTLY